MVVMDAEGQSWDGGILKSPMMKVTDLAPSLAGAESTRKAGLLEKRISGNMIYWGKKYVELKTEYLVFKNEESEDIKEMIKLRDITQVFRSKSHRHHNIMGLSASTTTKHHEHTDVFEPTESGGRSKRNSDGNCVDDVDFQYAFSVHVQKYGRMYHLRASSDEECDDWIEQISQQIKEAQRIAYEALGVSFTQRFKTKLRHIYDSKISQSIIALILIAVFALNIYDAEHQPEDHSETRQIIDHVDTVITVIFGVELLIQLFIYWFWDFFTDVWCLLDLAVVLLSIAETIMIELQVGGSVNTNFVRLLRIFRIVKIFSKMKALQRIIIAVSASIGPVCNTLLTFGIINSLYAVMGTKLFAEQLPDRFRTFSTTSFTLLQLATWDSWSGDIVRPLVAGGSSNWAIAFFVSYIVIVSLVIMNVMVAVLLEGFMGALARHETKERDRRAAFEHHAVAGPMDGLLITLANFSSQSDLSAQIQLLFRLFDVDDSASLSFEELRTGLQKLEITPTIKISGEDFESFTFGRALCNAEGALDAVNFEWAMRWQLQALAQRLVAERMQQSVRSHAGDAVLIFALKLALSELFVLSAPGCPRTAAPDAPAASPSHLPPSPHTLPPTRNPSPQKEEARSKGGFGGEGGGGEGEAVSELRGEVAASNALAAAALDVAHQTRDLLAQLLSPPGGAGLGRGAVHATRRRLQAVGAGAGGGVEFPDRVDVSGVLLKRGAEGRLSAPEVAVEELSQSDEGESSHHHHVAFSDHNSFRELPAGARSMPHYPRPRRQQSHPPLAPRGSGGARQHPPGSKKGAGGHKWWGWHGSRKEVTSGEGSWQELAGRLRADSDTGITAPAPPPAPSALSTPHASPAKASRPAPRRPRSTEPTPTARAASAEPPPSPSTATCTRRPLPTATASFNSTPPAPPPRGPAARLAARSRAPQQPAARPHPAHARHPPAVPAHPPSSPPSSRCGAGLPSDAYPGPAAAADAPALGWLRA